MCSFLFVVVNKTLELTCSSFQSLFLIPQLSVKNLNIWILNLTEKSRDGLFEWDTEKNKVNIIRHGISFSEAIGIFLDSNRQEFFDELHSSEEEQRYITIGRLPGKFLVVLVVSTDRNGITRIISARYASKKEEQLYYG